MPGWLKEWWPLVALAVPFLVGTVAWAVRMGLASKPELAAAKSDLAAELARLEARMVTIELEVRHLPTAEDMAELSRELTRIGAVIEASRREFESVGRAVIRIEDHLIAKKAN